MNLSKYERDIYNKYFRWIASRRCEYRDFSEYEELDDSDDSNEFTY